VMFDRTGHLSTGMGIQTKQPDNQCYEFPKHKSPPDL
jgi:hypothetical protein